MMEWFPMCVFLVTLVLPGSDQQSPDHGSGCGVTVCYGGSKMLLCDRSQILITNVTESSTGTDDVRAFQNLRRMCMGKSSCDTSVICNKRSLKVSYLCISEYSMERSCPGTLLQLASADGFIQSPSYPSTSIERCQWQINVPKDSYVTITVHDLEKTGQTQSHCEAGIQLSTTRDCVNHTLPSNTICHADNLDPMIACGVVTVNLVPSDRQHSKVRFWLSYKVIQFGDAFDLDLRQLSTTCPEGTYDKHMSVVSSLQGLPDDSLILPDPFDITSKEVGLVTSNITILERREIIQADMTERTVFYIAVAVAAISLTGLVIVTVVCIRRQRTLKAAGSIQVNRLPARPTVSNASANRPLPPIDKETKPVKQNGQPAARASLQDGYSRVADEIPYNSSQDSTRSPAYAEVDDNISPAPGHHVFRFGLNGERKSSVENVYSELNEEGDVYYEIYDKYAASPGPLSNDHAQLLKNKKSDKRHSISPKPGRSSIRPVSFEGPYAHMDGRTVSKDLSDSDCSLVLMDNEVYDHYESAHV